jgi:hypothetical protein
LGNAETKIFTATYPSPGSAADAFAVHSWSNLIATTDYLCNTQSDGSGTNLTSSIVVGVTKFASSMEISLTNNSGSNGFITKLQAQGTPVVGKDPVQVQSEDSSSQATYGQRTYPIPGEFMPSTTVAKDWCDALLRSYKDPHPLLSLSFLANATGDLLSESKSRDISDYITIVSADLGIDDTFFVESIRHRVSNGGKKHVVELACSPANLFIFTNFLLWNSGVWNTDKWGF